MLPDREGDPAAQLLLALVLAVALAVATGAPAAPPPTWCPARCKCATTAAICSGLSPNDLRDLAALESPPWLELAVLDSPELSPAVLAEVQLSSGWSARLRRLRFSRVGLDSLNGSLWRPGVAPGLTQLDLSGNLLSGDLALSCLAAAFPGLESLNVSRNRLTGIAAGTPPGGLAALRLFDMSRNYLTDLDTILTHLADATAGASVHELQLGGQGPATSGRLDSRILARYQNLRLADFSDSPRLTGIGYEFADSLTGLGRLRWLRFDRCPRIATFDWGPAMRRLRVSLAGSGPGAWNCTCGLAWLPSSSPDAASQVCNSPPLLRGRSLSSVNFTAELACRPPHFANFSGRASYGIGDSARLLCRVAGKPAAHVTWETGAGANVTYRPPHRFRYFAPADTFTNTFHSEHQWHWHTQYDSAKALEGPGSSRVLVLQDGSLYIDYVTRSDAGTYHCTADNGVGPGPVSMELAFSLKYEVLREVKKYGIIVGALSAASLLGIGFVIGLIRLAVRKCSEEERKKKKSIKEMLEHLESYRGAKMEQFRECKDWFKTYRSNQVDNYNTRVGKVKEICISNMVHMQENYNRRIAKIRDHCDLQIERLRENYNMQMSRIKDYRSNQVDRVRDQYNQQLLRIKEYAATQLERLREQYKAQQAYLMKVIENVSIDSCMTGSVTEEQLLDFRLDETPDHSDSEEPGCSQHPQHSYRQYRGSRQSLQLQQLSFPLNADDDLEDFVTAIGDGESRRDLDDLEEAENEVTSSLASSQRVVQVEVLPPPRSMLSSSLPDLPSALSTGCFPESETTRV